MLIRVLVLVAGAVVLTREQGKNGKLRKALEQRGIQCLEMPLVETAPGPDREQLVAALQHERFDWVCLTSPEAASVFLAAWRAAGKPSVRIAVVGAGTGTVLTDAEGAALAPEFVPSVVSTGARAPAALHRSVCTSLQQSARAWWSHERPNADAGQC